MRILFLDSVPPSLAQYLTKAGHECLLDCTSTKSEIQDLMPSVEGLVIRSRFKLDATFLEKNRHLRFIARLGAGLENIDLEAANRLEIACLSCPEGNRNAVGEHSLGLLLALFNKLVLADKSVRKGEWLRETHRGLEIQGKTIGQIGYGNMGQAFAKVLRGFDCEVIYYDLQKIPSPWKNARQVSLEVLKKEADVLSFHVPQTAKTHHYLDDRFIDEMKKPFYLINTARGSVVKTKALLKGLDCGKILGAGLDVLEYETSSFTQILTKKNDHSTLIKKLLAHPKVILSPHVAGWSIESNEKMARVIFEKIQDLIG